MSVAACHRLTFVPSVPILAAGVGVVVDLGIGIMSCIFLPLGRTGPLVVGILVSASWVVLNLLLATTNDDLYYTTIL